MTDTTAPATRLFGAQSMTAPLHDVVVKRPGAGVRRGLRQPGARVPARARPGRGAAPARRLLPGAHRPGRPRPPARRRDREPRSHLHVRLGARHRPGHDRPAVRQAHPPGRGGADARVGRRARHPGHRPAGGRRDGRRRRHVLASARRLLHRPVAAHEHGRRGPDGRARGRRRACLRRPVRERPGRVPAPALGHLADRRRPGGRVPAAAPGRPLRAARASGAWRSSRCPRRRS